MITGILAGNNIRGFREPIQEDNMRPFKIIAIMVFLVSLAYLISCTDRKIANRDMQENFTDTNVWRYSIRNNPRYKIKYISPANGATDIGIDFELTWHVAHSDPNPDPNPYPYPDPDIENYSYVVYFGVDPHPWPVTYTLLESERYISPWRSQDRCGELLQQIYSAQQSYRQEYGTYCLNGLCGGYYLNPDWFALLGISFTEIDYYVYCMIASQNMFTCVATANLDADADIDTWTINQNGDLVNTIDDLYNRPFKYNTVYYWKIIAIDSFGQEITGPVWSFTTAPQ